MYNKDYLTSKVIMLSIIKDSEVLIHDCNTRHILSFSLYLDYPIHTLTRLYIFEVFIHGLEL